jgi:CBS domain-containing protein
MSTSVVTTTPEMTVEGVFRLMINHRISGVPVAAGDGWPVGMIIKNDLSRGTKIGVRGIEGHRIVGPLYPVL